MIHKSLRPKLAKFFGPHMFLQFTKNTPPTQPNPLLKCTCISSSFRIFIHLLQRMSTSPPPSRDKKGIMPHFHTSYHVHLFTY